MLKSRNLSTVVDPSLAEHVTKGETMAASLTRKQFLIGTAAVGGAAVLRPLAARAAMPTVIKFAIDLPLANPLAKYAVAVADQLKKETNGEIEMHVFPNGELGSDTAMIAEVRSGAIQMMGVGNNILAPLVPSAAISSVGFAFKDAKTALAATDGSVGDIVRADIIKRGLQPMSAAWDDGFLVISTSTKPIKTPEDLKNFKIRVPESQMSVSLFRSLGAAPSTLNFNEVYTALQTRVDDGEEVELSGIEAMKFYQVQKYCSITNHSWAGYWMVMNGPFWKRLPADHQKVIATAFDSQALKERVAMGALNDSLQRKLTSQGLKFNTPNAAPFRDMLVKSGFYSHWQKEFGDELWSALEKYAGALA